MPTNLIEDYAYVRSRDTDPGISNISVLELVEEMVRAPGDHHWGVHSSGVLLDDGPPDQYYLILSGSDPEQPAQRIVFLASSDSFEVGYDPDGTVEWDDEEGEFVHDGAFSGLRTLAGSTLELVDGELVPFDLDLNDEAPIRVWLAEHREANDCGEPCSTGLAASLTLLIEKLEDVETDNRFVYGAHVGRVLSSTNLNDQHRGIYGDAVLVGEPNTPGRLGPEEPVSDPDHKSWLGQPNNAGGSVVRVGPDEWAVAYGIGWDNHLPEGSLKDVASRKRLVPYGMNGLDEDTLGDWLMVSAGYAHSLAIKKDGTLWSWGSNYVGQLGLGLPLLIEDELEFKITKPTQILIPNHPNTWKFISSNVDSCLAIDSNGIGWAWGDNFSGQLGLGDDEVGEQFDKPVKIKTTGLLEEHPGFWKKLSAGLSYSLGIDINDQGWAWGSNFFRTLGNPTLTNALGDPSDSAVPYFIGADLDGATGWKDLYASNFTSFGIDSLGRGWSWGANFSGALGINESNITTYRQIEPIKILVSGPNVTNHPGTWKQLSPANTLFHQYVLGIDSNGKGWAWGNNLNGQLGLGDTTQRLFPSTIIVETPNVANHPGKWQNLYANGFGLNWSLGIDSNGKGWAWGNNLYGQLGNDQLPTDSTTINSFATRITSDLNWKSFTSSGGFHALAIDSNDNGWSWGWNYGGQLGIGISNISDVVLNFDEDYDRKIPTSIPYVYKIYNAYTHGEVGRTKYLRQFGTEPLTHGVKFVSTTFDSLQAWFPSGNGSNQLILWRRGDDNDAIDPIEPEPPEEENDL
jgi:alpha-tubulin suppressor-like RCC1 family protein